MKTCLICSREMEDTRHVGVECFYDVHEVVPSASKDSIYCEVDEKNTYWGVTRHYPAGTKDQHFVAEKSVTEAGCLLTKIDIRQIPIAPIRLLEKQIYNIACCKSCRGDFLTLLGKWAKGEFISDDGDGDIPIRENGALKYITREEYNKRHESRVKNVSVSTSIVCNCIHGADPDDCPDCRH